MLGDVVELSVVVRDLEEAVARFTRLFGLTVHRRDESKEFGFKNAILPTGIGHIELMEPTDPGKPVGKFLATHGEGIHHVCLEVEDIREAIRELKAKGYAPLWDEPKKGAGGKFVVIEHKGERHPRITIEGSDGKILDFHYLPAKARIEVKDGQKVTAGQLLARQPKEAAGTMDIESVMTDRRARPATAAR